VLISKRFFSSLAPVLGFAGMQLLCMAVTPTISTAQSISLGCGAMNGSKATEAIVGVYYSQSFAVSGGVAPFHFDIYGGLPPVLLFDATAGTVWGSPSTPGTYAFTAIVTDSVGAVASASCSILVAQAPKTSTTGGNSSGSSSGTSGGSGNGKKPTK
jgi:hypothetical protein